MFAFFPILCCFHLLRGCHVRVSLCSIWVFSHSCCVSSRRPGPFLPIRIRVIQHWRSRADPQFVGQVVLLQNRSKLQLSTHIVWTAETRIAPQQVITDKSTHRPLILSGQAWKIARHTWLSTSRQPRSTILQRRVLSNPGKFFRRNSEKFTYLLKGRSKDQDYHGQLLTQWFCCKSIGEKQISTHTVVQTAGTGYLQQKRPPKLKK